MKLILFALMITFLLGCNSEFKKLRFEDGIEYFDPKLLVHFPEMIPIKYSQHVVSENISNSHPHVWLMYYSEKTKLDSLVAALDNVALVKYESDDSCLLVIDKHLNEKNWREYDKNRRVPKKMVYDDKLCHKDKLPVPNFYSETWRNSHRSSVGLEGFELYVLEAKSGIFMDSTRLPNGLYTPKGWTHGFSRGVALNKETNVVIYWADIW